MSLLASRFAQPHRACAAADAPPVNTAEVDTGQSSAAVQAFDVVDIDPYGSPNVLLDAAVQSVAEGGLLMVTATDVAVLCGNNAEACFTKYGSYALHREYCHEQALRVLLACVAQHAARHKRVIEPVLSMSVDFYVRMFLRVRTAPGEVKFFGEQAVVRVAEHGL